MTAPGAPRPPQTKPRAVHFVLRDGGLLDGAVYLNEGQALAPYLGSRKGGWMNIVNARWKAEAETHQHAVVRVDDVFFASSADPEVKVTFGVAGALPRDVDISVEDGTQIRGRMYLSDRQRMSDFLTSCGQFLPVIGATRMPSGESLGDIALHSASVKAVRDEKAFGVFAPTTEEAAAAWRSLRRSSTTAPTGQANVTRETVRGSTGSIEVITPGHLPDRRSVTRKQVVGSPPTPAATGAAIELTAEDRARGERVARHWLVQLASGSDLLPPDPLVLSDEPTLGEIWHGIATANEMSETELAVQVASACKLEMADLDEVTPKALREVPERLARKLGVVPVKVDGQYLVVAVSDPMSLELEQQLRFATRLTLRFVVAAPEDIQGALSWHYKPGAARP